MPVTCFVSYELHPTNMGGAGVLIHHAAEVLLKAEHEVVFLLDIPAEAFSRLIHQDVKTFSRPDRIRAYRVEELCEGMPYKAADFASVFQWKAFAFAWALEKLLAREQIDYVEYFEYCGAGYYSFVNRLYSLEVGAGGSSGGGGAKSTNGTLRDAGAIERPVLGSRLHGSLEVLDTHGQGAVRDTDRLILHGLERRALSLSEAVLTPSRTYFERYYKNLYKVEDARVIVSSPPKQPFPRVTKRPSASGPFSIAFIGRMFHLKGVDQLVHAAVMLMKQRPQLNFTVDLIGYDSDESPVPGSYTAYLKTLIPQRLRGRFQFLGQLSHEGITQRLDDALFAVFPNRVESFCYALHEVYDAGVPVVINDLPAFGDFFTHEKNAMVYDGTTQGLVAAMTRVIDDGALRERLCRPYPVAENPIGEFYDKPRALKPICGTSSPIDPIVVVLGHDEHIAAWPVLASLHAQTKQPARVLCLVPAGPDGEEALWWLGRTWHVRDTQGNPVEASDALTTSALAVLHSTDTLQPGWLERCSLALSRRPDMAFSGTWTTAGDRLDPLTIDIAPELFPFERGPTLARVLVRTEPGTLLADLFDTSLGTLGHTGYLWSAIHRWGHGTLLARPLLATANQANAQASPAEVQALLMRHGEPLAERLTLVAGLVHARIASSQPQQLPRAKPTVEQKVQLADELGGSLLAKMAVKKLVKRVRSGGRPPGHQ